MDSITVFGRTGTLTSIDLTIEFVGSELYECYGTISYQGYDTNPTDIIGIRKFAKTEKEVINLLKNMISSSLDLREFIRNKKEYLNC